MDLNTLVGNLTLGLETALSPANILFCFIGVFIGTVVGVLPGIGTLAALSMLLPLTFYLEPTTALIMLAGIWYGTLYGGSTAAILLNVPGTPAAAVTCVDGYPMTKQGKAGVALLMTTIASFFGATFGVILTMFFAPVIAEYALQFGSADYFALMVLGLVAACTMTNAELAKGLAMVALGLIIGTVGLDMYTGERRFVFGMIGLIDGISIAALAMGIFGVSEVIASIRTVQADNFDRRTLTFRSMLPSRSEVSRSILPIFRGASIGSFFGILPGTGPTLASFIAYATEKRVSKTPEKFGHGAIEGIMAPEAANNAADQTAFIPTMTLGIPGSATMAIMLGALMVQGISPGPLLMSNEPALFWGLVMSFWIGNLFLLILNVPLIGLWVRLLTIPYKWLYPAILMFVSIGVFSVSNNSFDVWLVMCFGVLGYLMRISDMPAAPLLLGFVLGPLMEVHFRRAMILSRGDLMVFLERPISATVTVAVVCLLGWSIYGGIKKWKAGHVERRTAD
jgi:TctA family transporter